MLNKQRGGRTSIPAPWKGITILSIVFGIIGVIPAVITYPNWHGIIVGLEIGGLICILSFCIALIIWKDI